MRYFFCTFSPSSHHLDANIVFVYQDNSSFIWATKSTLPSSSPFVLFPIITWFGLLPYKNHPTTIPHLIQIEASLEIRVRTNPQKIFDYSFDFLETGWMNDHRFSTKVVDSEYFYPYQYLWFYEPIKFHRIELSTSWFYADS